MPGVHRSRAWRIVRRVLVWPVAVLAGLLLLALLLLQTPWGKETAVNWAVERFNPFPGTTLTVGETHGTVLTGLELIDVTLVHDSTGQRLVHIDTIQADYGLMKLFEGRLAFDEAEVIRPTVTMHQWADSTWDLLNVLPEPDPNDTTPATLVVGVEDLVLRDGALSMDYLGDPELTAHVERLHATNFVFDPQGGTDLVLDTLRGQFTPPPYAEPVQVNLAARLDGRDLTIGTLRLQSPRSDVLGRGTLMLPDSAGLASVGNIDFTLTAEPLAFGDLAPFLPGLPANESVTLDLRAVGSGAEVQADLEAAFASGGTLRLDATGTPTTAGPLRYDVRAEVRQFDPSLFVPDNPALAGIINADVTADLAGDSLADLSGPFRLLLFDTRLGDYAPDRTVLTGDFADGQARIDLDTGLRGADLTLAGTVRPFGANQTYDLSGRVANLNMARFTGNPANASDLNARLRLEGRGFDPQTADLTAALRFGPSSYQQYVVEQGTLLASMNGTGTMGIDADITSPEGRVAAEGTLTFGGEVLRYNITEGLIDDFNVGALTGDTTAFSVNAEFSARGAGFDPNTMVLDANLKLSDTVYGAYTVEDADLDVALRRGALDLRGPASLNSGDLDLNVQGRPFAAVPWFTLERVGFQNLDIGALTQNPNQASDLNGVLRGTITGFDPETMQADLAVVLDSSRYNDQFIQRGQIDATLADAELKLTADLATDDGATTLQATVYPFADPIRYTLEEGTFDNFNVGALAGLPAWATDLNGTLRIDGQGIDPAAMTVQARFDLDSSRVNNEIITDGFIDANLVEGVGTIESRLNLSEGTVQLSGDVDLNAERIDAQGTVANLSLDRLMGNDTLGVDLSFRFDLDVQGFDPQTMVADFEASSRRLRYRGVESGGFNADLHLEDGVLQVDTLRLVSNLADVRARGHLALFDSLGTRTSDFHLAADLHTLEPLAELLGPETKLLGSGFVAFDLTGTGDDRFLDLQYDMNGVVFNEMRLSNLDGRALAEFDRRWTPQAAEVKAHSRVFSMPNITVEHGDLTFTYADESIGFDFKFLADERRDARIKGDIDLRLDNRRIRINDFAFRFDEDRWELLQEASISYGEEYRIRNFLIYTGDQQIALDGVVDLDGEQNLIFTMENFRADAVADLFGFDGLGGTVNAFLDLTGPAFEPNVRGNINAALTSKGRDVGDLRMDVNYDSLTMHLDATLTHDDGSELVATSRLPMDLRLRKPAEGQRAVRARTVVDNRSVYINVRADSFTIGWVDPFLDPETIRSLGGQLNADITVAGTTENPQLSGTAFMDNGSMHLTQTGRTYRNVQLDLEFADDQVLVNHMAATSNGTAIGHGTIDLANLTLGEYNLSISAEDFLAVDVRDVYRAEVNADLTMTGTTSRPSLKGEIRVQEADYYIQPSVGDLDQVELTEDDIQMLERRFGLRISEADTSTFNFYYALAMDLKVRLDRGTWLRAKSSPEMAIQLTGNLDVYKANLADNMVVFGSIDVVTDRSYVKQFGRRFDIDRGEIDFNGPPDNPRLNIVAEYNPNETGFGTSSDVTISLTVTGRPEQLEFELTSSPQMEMSDIISYLAFGGPASEKFQLGGGQQGEALLGLGLSGLTNIVENAAGDELGLDVIEIQFDPFTNSFVLIAGKYVSPRFFVAANWIANQGQESEDQQQSPVGITLEYALLQQLLARLSTQGTENTRITLQWEYSY